MSEVTQLLNALERGEKHAANDLFPLVYDELRQIAAQKLAKEKPGQTLQPTALVHEAYLRLVGTDPASRLTNREYFFAAAAEAIRRILVDNARRKKAKKHGGAYIRHDVDLLPLTAPLDDEELLAVHEVLDQFHVHYPVQAELVKLRFFMGLTLDEAAETLAISTATADRHWAFAKAWLYQAFTTTLQNT